MLIFFSAWCDFLQRSQYIHCDVRVIFVCFLFFLFFFRRLCLFSSMGQLRVWCLDSSMCVFFSSIEFLKKIYNSHELFLVSRSFKTNTATNNNAHVMKSKSSSTLTSSAATVVVDRRCIAMRELDVRLNCLAVTPVCKLKTIAEAR